MYVLVTYDVETATPAGAKRLRLVAKQCQNYGQRVQNSVFECLIDERHFVMLKDALAKIIDHQADSIRFYSLGNNWSRKIEHIGRQTAFNLDGDLII
ncbi:MAG: CRISPR-associated endonuclease Cas2 [Bacteroidales bacterium]|nr:CRISPR-associated endonuclease Cas2 [Bacteroidales bacterium]MDD7726208.1 CRISPR-associated endonuclease Cas2 [Bacteroidales bacterium]MDY4174628.1 CRISPR-associated endonuclease Cas2 [Bacteroidales bacterium]